MPLASRGQGPGGAAQHTTQPLKTKNDQVHMSVC